MRRTWIVAGYVIGGVAVLWLLFGPLASWLGGSDLNQLDARDRLAAVSTIRGQIGTVLSAAFMGGGPVLHGPQVLP
jgi:hypothetical protein